MPPRLREEPRGPDEVEGFDPLFRLGGVVAVVESGIGLDGIDGKAS